MAPLPQEKINPPSEHQNEEALTGEEVVISGISGLFPNSNNVQEFMDNLYNKVDMVTEDKLNFDHVDLPKYSGKISGIDKFDAQFFRVPHQQAHTLEPMTRKMMEQAYCAIYDAGINPVLLKGKKIGVFTAAQYNEAAYYIITDKTCNAFSISGSSKTMLSNRISYWLDAKGPSYTVESFSGSMICLEHAVRCIKTGVCDAAIVGGCEFTNDSIMAVNLRNMGLISLDGKTRCFDKNGDGYVQSQALGMLFLQKAKDAKRIYAEILNVGVEYGLKEGMELRQKRKPEEIVRFLKTIYADSSISPNDIEYVEAYGAANPEADSNELQAISQIFGGKKPIKVGCVKSNMGNNDTASGACAITKLCLAYNKGKLPGNLHYDDLLDIPAIKEKKIEVLTETTQFNRGFSAVNSFSCGGTNCHVVLKGHFKPKNVNLYKTSIPRLVPISGRHEEGVKKVFNFLKKQPIDPEVIGLLNNIYQVDTPSFTSRGYIIIDSNEEQTVSLAESIKLYQGTQRPLCLVFSGMGSQWAGMGADLMRIPLFAAAVEKCRQILEPKGVDIVRILTSPDNTIFDNVLNSFVGIAATQIALTDMMKKLGLVPDYIIGHSLGEMGCAYYDGCFTLEECILTAYARGLVSIRTKLIKGAMAAVGLGYKDMLALCPPEIDIACHNSSEFCTISGPTEVMSAFILDLKAKGIFAKEVPSGNVAYHSRYIQKAGPEFLRALKNIIETPVKRSEKWISTSWPEEKWNEPSAQYSSPEYHTNNLLSSVYFEEAARYIPNNAVVVEVAPHGLLQAILKRSHPECTHIPLTRRGHEQPIKFLFEAFGKLYQEGYDIKVDVLYPKIEYPVSTETPLLSHFVEWYHEEDWIKQSHYIRKQDEIIRTPSRTIYISMQEDNFKFLAGHCREGNAVLPEAAILVYVWETLAMYKNMDHKQTSVKFQDVQFHTEVFINKVDTVKLQISFNKGNAYFEVTKEGVMVVTGNINIELSKYKSVSAITDVDTENNYIELNSDDVYNILKIKGHSYQKQFKSIMTSSSHWSNSQVKMTENWITFLDSLIQLNILATNYDGVSIPKLIKELSIDTMAHISLKIVNKQNKLLMAELSKTTGVTKCAGVTIKHIIFNRRPLAEYEPDVLKPLSYHSRFQDRTKESSFCKMMNKLKDFKLTFTKCEGKNCLKWTEMEVNSGQLVKVCFAAPSLRDVQNVVGLVDSNKDLGMDFSGIDCNGNKVMGFIAGGALASKVEPDRDLLWPVPEHWTLQEAATVPLPYVHAYYCLLLKSDLLPRHTVFVTGGAGALGQAVIAICLSLGCTVYTCVGDRQKKMFLLQLFPGLKENNIGYSNDSSFPDMVKINSKNKRCDLVINCATGYIREHAMKCVGFNCKFLDVNDYDLQHNQKLGMQYLDQDKNYQIVNLSNLFRLENVAEKKLLQKWISEGIANGTVKPISYVEYSIEDVERAFRLLSLSKHRGRALINFNDSDTLSITPRMQYASNGAYLVVCDTEVDFGIQIANHLLKQGAKHIVFYQKFEKISGFVENQIASWQNLGVAVTLLTGNLQKSNWIDVLRKNVKINGIFIVVPRVQNTKNSLQDTYIENINLDIETVNFFDKSSRNNCPELKYFVIFANHSKNVKDFKPSLLDKVCQLRAEDGLPALVVYSALLDEEYVNDKSCDIRPMTIPTTLKAMEISLKQNALSILAYNTTKKTYEFSDAVAEILGLKNIYEIDENLTLEKLASKEIIFEEIKSVIKEYYKYDLSADYIKQMKINSLLYLDEAQNKLTSECGNKLATFYNFVDKHEIKATESFIAMHTLISGAEGELNLYAKATNLMLIPGFEGHHHIFKSLCEGLKVRATTLQLGPDVPHESIQEMALELKQQIKRRFVLEPQFYLLGYSFGVNVALEIASLLEQDGLVGVVYCLDSSPDALRAQLDAYLGHSTEAELQNSIINHLFYVMSEQKCNILENELITISSWEEKVTKCVDRLKDVVKYSNQYKRSLIEAFYNKIRLSYGYDPEFKLGSKIILLKGTPHPEADFLPADYGLSKYAENPVTVIEINSSVASAPYDSNVANTVNKFLDLMLLEDFKAKNLCECYSITHI